MYLIAVTVFVGAVCLAHAELTGVERDEAHDALYSRDGTFQGDLMLTPPQKAAIKNRNAIANLAQRWNKGIIPYTVDPSLNAVIPLIQQAAAQIAQKTGNCIRFVPRTNEPKFVRMFFGNGCYSYLGNTGGSGSQDLSLGQGCHFIGTVVHEMLHAVGFDHEQNRPDRDQFLQINRQNIMPGQEHNFNLTPGGQTWSSFDFNSVMLYGEKAFSKNGQATMVDKTAKHRLTEPYDKAGMSPDDLWK